MNRYSHIDIDTGIDTQQSTHRHRYRDIYSHTDIDTGIDTHT